MKRVNKKKKAFTLIELLAVIVILGIIATIVTATISKVTSNAKKQAFKESARGLIRAAESYIGEYILKNHQAPEFPMTFTCDGTSCKYNDIELAFAGEIPKSGAIIADGLKKVEASYLSDGKYCAAGTKTDMQVAESCADIDITKPTVTGTASDLTFNLNLVDAESGIAAYCVTTTDDSSSCSWISTTSATLEHEVPANGTYYVFAKDNKGNISSSISLIAQRITFAEQILMDNPTVKTNPTLTTTSDAANESGLYSMIVTNGYGGQSEESTTYYFRGNVTNNYVTFAGLTWRIVRINENGTVRLITSSGVGGTNTKFNSTATNYKYGYYTESEYKNSVDSWYSSNITGDNASKVDSGNYFCEAARVAYNGGTTIGNVTMTNYSSYTPDLACVTDANDKGLVNANVGLLTYDEAILAGGYRDSQNITYYLYCNYLYILMTPAYWSGTKVATWRSYGNTLSSNWPQYSGAITAAGVDSANDQTGSYRLRPVINLKSTVTVTGSGTSGNPYIVE